MHQQQADLSEARRLLGMGLKLVELQPYTKQPIGLDWNRRPAKSINEAATGYGLMLAQNKLCSVDPDSWELAKRGMAALGFDLEQIMNAGVRTRSTRPGSGGRSTFAAEGDLEWIKFRSASTGVVLELRASSPNLQDAIPGLVYRDKTGRVCTQTYSNCKRLDDPPPLPDQFLEWWQWCSTDLDYLHKQEQLFFAALETVPQHSLSTGKGTALAFPAPRHRAAYNAVHTVEEILERHGYSYDRRLQRWAPPTATGEPGVRPIPGKDGLWRSDHASDPLSGTFDAWIAHVVLDHAGDLGAAQRAVEAEGLIFDLGSVGKEEGSAPAGAGPNRLLDAGFWASDAGTHTDLPYLIKGLFDRGQMIVLWGPPGSGKTFAALSMAAHVGAGRSWAGRRVKRGKVLYVCAESTRKRLENRTRALLDAFPELKGADLFLVPLTLDLLNGDADIVAVLAACEQIGDVALIVVDTLAVTFGGGDENSPEDMGKYVSNMKLLKDRTGAAVMVVHHCGKDEARGMRGHSSLLGALDGELAVERPDPKEPRIFKAGKLREGESFCDLFTFDLEVKELGIDPDGDPVTTCVVVPKDVGSVLRMPSTKAQFALIQALEERRAAGDVAWTEKEIREIAAPLMHRNSVRKVIFGLNKAGWLKASVGGWALTQEAKE